MQNYTSANTSINSTKVPAVFKKVKWVPGTYNLDLGGGKYDTATEYLNTLKVSNLIIDPYNRSEAYNNMMVDLIDIVGGVDTCTLSNVLNVINDKDARADVLADAWLKLKKGGTLYVTVYEGDKSFIGRRTKSDCWQNNCPLKYYLKEVYDIFDNATIHNGMIIAHKEV